MMTSVFDMVTTYSRSNTCRQVVMIGDWNSHNVRDCESRALGRFRLPTPTSRHSTRMFNFLEEGGIWHIDSVIPAQHHATWLLPATSALYELDYCVSNIAPNTVSSRRLQKLATVAVAGTNHFGKTLLLQLHGKPESKKSSNHATPRSSRTHMLWIDLLRGPSDEARALQEQFCYSTQTRLAAARRTHQPQRPIPWSSLSSLLVQSAEQHCGQAPLTSEIPLLNESRHEELRDRESLVASWNSIRLIEDPGARHQAKKQHTQLSRTMPECPSLSPWKSGD